MTKPISAVVFDYGGVLTNPLDETFLSFCQQVAIDPSDLRLAMYQAAVVAGSEPMARLEIGQLTEDEFVDEIVAQLPRDSRNNLDGRSFGELWFAGRRIRADVVQHVATLRQRGLATALLTNNVKEWRPLWRAQLDVDSLFDVVVDSSEVGVRKPDPEIFGIVVTALNRPAESCLFVDDLAINCDIARSLGMSTVVAGDDVCAQVEAALTAGVADQ